MNKIITVYFSRKGQNYFGGDIKNLEKGNTAIAAEYIHTAVGGDIFEIEPIEDYPLGYHECTEKARSEKTSNARPKLKSYIDLDKYDIIFVGYPNWWGTMPMPVFSLLECRPIVGKKIIPFCTHEGSLMGTSEQDLLRTCRDSIVMKGLAIQGSSVMNKREEIATWAKTHI